MTCEADRVFARRCHRDDRDRRGGVLERRADCNEREIGADEAAGTATIVVVIDRRGALPLVVETDRDGMADRGGEFGGWRAIMVGVVMASGADHLHDQQKTEQPSQARASANPAPSASEE